jgi:hypothetical protein
LLLFLGYGPQARLLPGVIVNGRAGLAESLGWTVAEFDAVFTELERNGEACADWDARLLFLPRVLADQAPDNPYVVASWRREFTELPDCDLKTAVGSAVESLLSTKPSGWFEAWTVGKSRAREEAAAHRGGSKHRVAHRVPDGVADGVRHNEKENEKEMENEKENETRTAARGRAAFHGKRLRVPQFLHDEFTRRIGTAPIDLKAWYAQEDQHIGSTPLLVDDVVFWKRAFEKHITPQLKGGTDGGVSRPIDRMHDRGRRAVKDAPIHRVTFQRKE